MLVHPELGYYDEREDLTAAKLYAPSRLAFGRARALPPVAFRSKVFADLEDEKLWTRAWIFVGGLDQIPAQGDMLPYTVGHHGVHVQRDAAGRLIGRFNKAQHGGCRAVPLQCQTGIKTRCSFTSCGHSRDRDAIPADELGEGTPQMRQYLGEQPERLLPVRVECFGPLVHVNLDHAAPGLDAQLGALRPLLAPYLDGGPRGVAGFWVEHGCNWKLAGKAFLDHAGVPGGEAGGGRGRASSKPAAAEIAQHTTRRVALPASYGGALPAFAGLDKKGRAEARLIWAFPNLLIAALPDHVVTIGIQPTAFTTTLHRVRLYLSPKARGIGAEHPEVVRLLAFWRETIARGAERAAAEQREAERWGTPSWPETAGKPRPVEASEHGYRFQRYLVDRLLAEHDYYWAGPLTDARLR
ncbi:MAG: SRPBCC family protein [Alphaproteobacteria bacterium]